MPGLMNAAQGQPTGGSRYDDMPQSGPAMGQGQRPGMGPGGNPMEPRQASPEQQEVYDQFVAQAMTLMYDQEMLPRLLELLTGGGDPVDGLAHAAALITARVATSAEQNGVPISGDIVFNAGTEIVNQLADLSDAAQIGNFAEDHDMLEAAYFRALDEFRTLMQGAGRINEQAAQRDLQGLQAMSESGELESTLRALAENDPRMSREDRPDTQGEPPPGQGARQMPRREQPRDQQTMRG